jgi:hypothetical protein
MEFIDIMQQYVNFKAVAVAVIGTQVIKFFLPPVTKEVMTIWDRFTVRSSPILTRSLPFIPVVIAFVFNYFLERDSAYTMDDAVRGLVSGASAAYTYRTTKTLIFGE